MIPDVTAVRRLMSEVNMVFGTADVLTNLTDNRGQTLSQRQISHMATTYVIELLAIPSDFSLTSIMYRE